MVTERLSVSELRVKAAQIRKDVLAMIHGAKTGHTGGALSSTDIMTALYYGVMNIDPKQAQDKNRDRFILSKGHSVEPLWCILADQGFFDKKELETFSAFGTRLIGHPNNKVAGVEMNTGSLGHGISVASGMALKAKRKGDPFKVFVLMGDGEQAEGSVWEGAMFASHYQLDNLLAIIDRNRLQISGDTEDVMSLEPLADKWAAFGWHVVNVDGNNMKDLLDALGSGPEHKGKPTLIMANTVKGKGVSFIENKPGWHHKVPTDDQLAQANSELDAIISEEEGCRE